MGSFKWCLSVTMLCQCPSFECFMSPGVIALLFVPQARGETGIDIGPQFLFSFFHYWSRFTAVFTTHLHSPISHSYLPTVPYMSLLSLFVGVFLVVCVSVSFACVISRCPHLLCYPMSVSCSCPVSMYYVGCVSVSLYVVMSIVSSLALFSLFFVRVCKQVK